METNRKNTRDRSRPELRASFYSRPFVPNCHRRDGLRGRVIDFVSKDTVLLELDDSRRTTVISLNRFQNEWRLK